MQGVARITHLVEQDRMREKSRSDRVLRSKKEKGTPLPCRVHRVNGGTSSE